MISAASASSWDTWSMHSTCFCSIALGETNPAPKIEQTKTSKADLIAALKDAFA